MLLGLASTSPSTLGLRYKFVVQRQRRTHDLVRIGAFFVASFVGREERALHRRARRIDVTVARARARRTAESTPATDVAGDIAHVPGPHRSVRPPQRHNLTDAGDERLAAGLATRSLRDELVVRMALNGRTGNQGREWDKRVKALIVACRLTRCGWLARFRMK